MCLLAIQSPAWGDLGCQQPLGIEGVPWGMMWVPCVTDGGMWGGGKEESRGRMMDLGENFVG